MTIAEYRKARGITQKALAEELQTVAPGIDVPLISKMEKGLCGPNESLQYYLDVMGETIGSPRYEKKDLTPIQQTIYYRLKQGRVSRAELQVLTGRDDRTIRDEIASMRKMGYRIGSIGYGYILAKTEAEYKEVRKRYIGRAYTELKTVAAMDAYAEGQMEM